MPRKPSARRSARRSSSGSRPAGSERDARRTEAELHAALDGLLEEGIGNYDDLTEAGRRRMLELNAGFAAGEALLERLRERPAVRSGEQVDALAAVIRYILHWAGEAGTLDEPKETLAAMRRARRALERASAVTTGAPRPARRRRGGAA